MKACISIDVSKGKSYYQGFRGMNEPIMKAKPIHHDRPGFEELTTVGDKLKSESREVLYVFESTGIYHKSLQSYLESRNEQYVILNPLTAAKVRKSKLRSTKTDQKDCQTIALAYYAQDYEPHGRRDAHYETLRAENRQYVYYVQILRQMKVRFRNLLDIVFPRWDEMYENPYTEVSLALLKKYPHPEALAKSQAEAIARHLEKATRHRSALCRIEALKAKTYASQTISGCTSNAVEPEQLRDTVDQVERQLKLVDECLEKMKAMVREEKFFGQLSSIPGIGEILAVRLMAEMGDLNRFSTSKRLVAYAGIDPVVYQSGKKDGEHLPITKKGNKNLRTLLYLAIGANIRLKKSNSILDFYNKKRQQATPLAYRAAVIACANKLLRIIYSMYRSGEEFQF
ncbi:MAG TPA: IS110 family transposase [Bacillota bacterium]|nr:IS110 family transposase [Bacillota bacterium]